MKEHRENPFKKLETHEELPDDLKKKVMASIGFAEMLSGVAELFTVNMAETAGEMIKTEPGKAQIRKEERKKDNRKSDFEDDSKSQ
ncbi:MAG: hypothetical protein ABJF04_16050 [Reichenbachiella sp.]|uniref:hypothetical protein n=1 Tax=Reichenbachiella sp. TaxID=2184521 RepID=UPI003265070E